MKNIIELIIKTPSTLALIICMTLMPISFTACTRTVYTPIHSTTTIIDTVTQQVSDSSTLRALFECDSSGQVILRELYQAKGKLATTEFEFSGGELKTQTRWQTKYIDRLVQRTDTVTVVKEILRTEQVKHIPKFFWYCFAIALLATLYTIYKLIKRFR